LRLRDLLGDQNIELDSHRFQITMNPCGVKAFEVL